MLTNLFYWLKSSFSPKTIALPKANPVIIPRAQHSVSRNDISKLALKVLYRLHDAGFQAYLVGGCVRDILLGQHPKDFDVVTNAHPEQIIELFRNSRVIGRRFRLVHVHFGGQIVEVATFRASHPDDAADPSLARSAEDGMIIRDNIYGSFEEDVWRRDFTVNALYYNIADYSLIDCVEGLSDLQHRVLRVIGDPEARFREDPVRMLRALRFAAKLGFTLDPSTEAPLQMLAPLLSNVPGARLFDEFLKLFLGGYAYESFCLLSRHYFFQHLFPKAYEVLIDPIRAEEVKRFIELALKNTDQRIIEEKPVAPFFLLAALLWHAVHKRKEEILLESRMSVSAAFHLACEQILHEQRSSFSVPRRITYIVREIWMLQLRFLRRQKRAAEIFSHPRFRAAFDFLVLRAQAGDIEAKLLATWWEEYIAGDENKRKQMTSQVKEGVKKKRRRKRRPKPEPLSSSE